MSKPVWYFAYGSNMQPATFRGRRGIVPLAVRAARLTGWRLTFDKPPILTMGEAMANIVEEPGCEVFGVAYAVSNDDLAHIELTEGVLIGNYHRVDVMVRPIESADGTLAAVTLASDRRDPTLRPSRRYMAIVIEGAEAHGLPASWLDWLRTVPAGEETPEAAAARGIIDQVFQKKEPR